MIDRIPISYQDEIRLPYHVGIILEHIPIINNYQTFVNENHFIT